jgi:hypothetical protein
MKTIKVICENCGKPFDKLKKEINRCKKEGMKNYCSRSCVAHYRNGLMTDEYWKKQYEKQKKTFDIKSQSGNRKDKHSPFRYFIGKCKQKERDKNVSYDIDLDYIEQLWKEQNGVCPYTKLKMVLPSTLKEYKKLHCLTRASLDRINSSKGYVKGNVEFVCLGINFAKNDFEKKEMMSFVKDIISSQNTLSITQEKPS